jgi:hypothetical protein
MRPTLLFIAGAGALILGGQALAASNPSSSGAPTAPPPTTTTNSMATPPDTTSGDPTTPPAATGTGANTSATVGALSVGEPVKDNTGATIGAIADLKADAGGNQMAVIKMGADQFQVSADKLGAADGAATINLTQAQIATMLHGKTGAAGAPSGQ